MRHLAPLTALALLFSCTPVPAETMTKALWLEDLDYLARELVERHAAPFAHVSEEAFGLAVAEIREAVPKLEDHQIQVEMGRLVAMLGDGHTELFLPQHGRDMHYLPFAAAYYGDELRLFAGRREAADLVGMRVTAIGGVPVGEAYTRVVPLIARDNVMELKLSAPSYLRVAEVLHAVGLSETKTEASLTLVADDGAVVTRTLKAVSADELNASDWTRARVDEPVPLYLRQRERHYWFDYLEDEDTVYVKYNRCANEKGQPSIKAFAKKLFALLDQESPERLVLDLRHNRGGNYHRSAPLVEGLAARPRWHEPGRLYVITGPETFSAASVTALQLEQQVGAILAGEPGRSRPNGSENYEWFHLPHSGLRINYSDKMKDHAPELGDAELIAVDLPAENSFDVYRSGGDEVLATVLRQPLPRSE